MRAAGVAYISCDCSTRHHEVNRLLPPQPRVDARQTAFLLERRAHRRRRPARPLRVAPDLARRPRPRSTSSCSRRATSSSTSAARHRLARHLALALAERVPVDARLPRVDVLIDQPARELLEPPVDLALDERGRHLEGHAAPPAASSARRAPRARPRAGPRARDPRARARAARRASRTRPGPSRTRRRAPAARGA